MLPTRRTLYRVAVVTLTTATIVIGPIKVDTSGASATAYRGVSGVATGTLAAD